MIEHWSSYRYLQVLTPSIFFSFYAVQVIYSMFQLCNKVLYTITFIVIYWTGIMDMKLLEMSIILATDAYMMHRLWFGQDTSTLVSHYIIYEIYDGTNPFTVPSTITPTYFIWSSGLLN